MADNKKGDIKMDRAMLRAEIKNGIAAKLTHDDLMRGWEKLVIEEFLSANDGNQCATARKLNMHRNTLAHKIGELQIDVKQYQLHQNRFAHLTGNRFAKKRTYHKYEGLSH